MPSKSMEYTYVGKSILKVSRGYVSVRSYDSDSHHSLDNELQKIWDSGINVLISVSPPILLLPYLPKRLSKKSPWNINGKRNEYVITTHVCVVLSNKNIIDTTKAS